MANEFKIKKGLIVTGASGGTVVDIQGSQGQLFSVTDDLSGSIFAVSDISGVPILDVNSSGLVTVDGPFTQTGGGDSNFSGDVNIKSVFDFDTATDLFSITNNQNTGGINLSGNNSRIYFGGNRAIEGAQGGTNLTFAEGYTSSYFQSNVNITGDVALTGSSKYIYLRTGTNSGLWQEDDFSLRFGTNNTEALELDNVQNATFAAQAFSAATSSGDASSTLTTKGYVDGLITGATIYRGTWDPDITANSGNGTPDLSAVTQTSGYYYICSDIGTAHPNGTTGSPAVPCEPDSWAVGDWVIWNDDIPDCAGTGTGAWQKIDNTSVLSGIGTGQTVALWEGAGSVTDSETLGNAPITVSGNNTTFAGGLTGTTGTFSGNVNVSGDIEIDNTSGDPFLKLKTSAQEYVLRIDQSDSEKFQIRDTTSSVTALSIDTSSNATFAGNITFGDSHFIGDDADDNLLIQSSANENIIINSPDDDLLFRTAGTTRLQITNTLFSVAQNATFAGTVTAADLLTVNGDGHLFLGADGETPKIDMMYVDSVSGAGWDTRIFTGRTDDLPNAQAFPTSTIAGGFGTQYQANSDGAFFGIIPYATGHYRPIINWGDDVADTPFSFQFNGSDIVTINYVGGITAPSFTGDHRGTINTATTGVTQTVGNNSTLIATTAYADAAAAAVPQGTVTGTGTTGRVIKFTDGANGVIGDSILAVTADSLDFTNADFAQIKFRESGAITIDSDNDQSSRNFQIKDGSGSSLLTILDTGNVGINETTPAAFLDIQPSASSRKVTRIANDVTSTYFYNAQVDAILAWTCGSYYQAEVVITANQTNGGTTANLYIRGIWSNNHTSHHWDELEHIGSLPGSTFTMSVGQNGSTTASGRLELDFNYGSGSFAQLNVRVTDFYGSHSYTIT